MRFTRGKEPHMQGVRLMKLMVAMGGQTEGKGQDRGAGGRASLPGGRLSTGQPSVTELWRDERASCPAPRGLSQVVSGPFQDLLLKAQYGIGRDWSRMLSKGSALPAETEQQALIAARMSEGGPVTCVAQ